MLFSLILPIYNSERYLKRCLKSILAQTYNDFEVIAIDDGSTDSSTKILNEFSNEDSRIKIYHYKNSGVTKARKRGFLHARGDFIISVDSDDTINSDLLLELYKIIIKYPTVDLIRYRVKMINDLPNYDHEIYNIDYKTKHSIMTGLEALKLWTLPNKKNDVFWMYAIKRTNMKIIFISPNLKTNGDFAIVPLIIAKSQKVMMTEYIGYNFTCDNFLSLTHAFKKDSMQKRSLDFITAYLFIKKQLKKVEKVSGENLRYLQDNFDERLKRRFYSLDDSLQLELRTRFSNALKL